MSKITRRDFLKIVNKVLAATGLAALFGPVVAYFYPPNLEETPSDPVLVAPAADLPVGKAQTISFGRYPALIINTPDGLRAYSAVCTHFACICKWDETQAKIVCPCHDGYFDPDDGHVLAGPPPTGLKVLEPYIENGNIYVRVGGEA